MLFLWKKYSDNTQWGETFPSHQAVQRQRMGLTPCQEEREGSLSSFIQENRGDERRKGPVYARGTDYAINSLAQVADMHALPLSSVILKITYRLLHGNSTAHVPWCLQNFQGVKGAGRRAWMDQESPKAINRKDCRASKMLLGHTKRSLQKGN